MVLERLNRYMQKKETRFPPSTTHKNKFNTCTVSPQTRETKGKINKWDYIKLKSSCTAKEITNKIKRQAEKWKNTFTDILIRG